MIPSTTAPKQYSGTLKEIFLLFLPLALTTLSSGLVPFIEKLFFAQLSAEAVEAAVSVTYVYLVFQLPCLVLVMMCQVQVGRLQGAGEERSIGSTVWQFIWFSLLSSLIVIPLGTLFGYYYFKGTVIEEIALPYLYFLLSINMFYPLAAALFCFYIGRGKTRLCLFATLGAYATNLTVTYLLVFGVEGHFSSFGLIGGAIGNLVAQGGLSITLLAIFLKGKNASVYGTRQWRFQPKLFWDCIYPGIFRALNRINVVLTWACMSSLMMAKQGDYLLFWSLGSTVSLFLPFIGEAICQALTTVMSNVIGCKTFPILKKVDFNGYLLVFIILGLVGIPMLLMPQSTFNFLFPDYSITPESVERVFFGLWIALSLATLAYVPVSRILALKDTKFFLVTGSTSWLSYYLVMYLALEVFEVPADYFWTVIGFSNLIILTLYLGRVRWLDRKKIYCDLTPQNVS